MRAVIATCLISAAVAAGVACNGDNWTLGSYTDALGRLWYRATWLANGVEFGHCLAKLDGAGNPIGLHYCNARQNQLVNGCMPMQPQNWCVGQPPPQGIDAIYVVNY